MMSFHALLHRITTPLSRPVRDIHTKKPSQEWKPPDDPQAAYQLKLEKEIENYREVANVHDLPQIFHYWSNKYLVPKFRQFGFGNPQEFFATYMMRVMNRGTAPQLHFISIGSGNCEFEIEIAEKLLVSGADKFLFECMDLSPHMLELGKKLAEDRGVASWMEFLNQDANSWHPGRPYEIIMANQALHHFVELEILFEKIYDALSPSGYFLTDDIIGRNGHMRWPEALEIVNDFWKVLPEMYKYNHQLKRVEREFGNWDCSQEGFEGI